MTRVVGLTGGIGAGKSEALSALGRMGAETLSTDLVVGGLLSEDAVRDRLAERWGAQVAPSGNVDAAAVAAIVFERPEELAWLESQLHPLVGERVAAWRAQLDSDTEVAVVEVPLLYEAGIEDGFDEIVAVIAPDDVRERRAAERGITDLAGREQRQLAQAEKAERADHVIVNDGSLADLEEKLAALLEALRR